MSWTGEEMAMALGEHRALLLGSEAIGWLHMTGKAKAEFLRQHGDEDIKYDYKKWYERENPPFPWSDLLRWLKEKYPLAGDSWPSSLTDFISRHMNRTPGSSVCSRQATPWPRGSRRTSLATHRNI